MARRLPTWDDRVLRDVAVLRKLNGEQLMATTAVALDVLTTSDATSAIKSLAAQLQSRPHQVQSLVFGFSSVLWDCAKANLREGLFAQALQPLELPPGHVESIVQVYEGRYDAILERTAFAGIALHEFKDLDWRIDVEVSRRSIVQEVTPSFMLRLDLARSDRSRCSAHMQADAATMRRLQSQLEAALAEEKSVHSRRFQRYIQ
uniref:COMM domain-containing protein n=1 Tax=Rhizochromulina marina TaxID=1034831 RepID=A0A7S2W7N7_9STRA|eukprot:CAMPEP_0118964974 /NCGR_PEP_ID=MMETSP1173-20130426/2569_1 /TAXON_ID=1034831 /ORGANISM="Rhizochromulina marina cf, Strain CCMP1243" /LENGTH=203 /DNA_ID=CAMNT_0006913505 /DNA_START=1 /DNA_END=612 /DNA_ORIENTATION=+